MADKGGRLTYYERPGMSNFADMKKAGITRDDLLQHYIYCMEYLWKVRVQCVLYEQALFFGGWLFVVFVAGAVVCGYNRPNSHTQHNGYMVNPTVMVNRLRSTRRLQSINPATINRINPTTTINPACITNRTT